MSLFNLSDKTLRQITLAIHFHYLISISIEQGSKIEFSQLSSYLS